MDKLDFDTQFKVKYCIPEWLKQEQIKISTSRIRGRIEPSYQKHTDPIALIGFGPSLNDTWEKVKDFKYIMTCSGSHKFLVDRGVIPTFHCEVDPRDYKIELLGTPHPYVTYFAASSCHPRYFDWLEQHNANIKLWHVFDSHEEGLRVLPRGEWALTGGSSVGLRMLVLARFLGFTDFHIFGLDGSKGESGSHASLHPNPPKDDYYIEYDGRIFYTAPSLLYNAKEIFHELDQLDVNTTFYGDGLIQSMAKNYVKKDVNNNLSIGVNKPHLISPEYKELNERLHKDNLSYGIGGRNYLGKILKLYNKIGAKSLLDYGCGKGFLAKNIDFPIWEYDPCIIGKDSPPRAADLVVCINVLEHIEPDYLDIVLNDIARCTKICGYFVIDTGEADKTFHDGSSPHKILESREWWEEKLRKHFKIDSNSIIRTGRFLHVAVTPLVGILDYSLDKKDRIAS